MPLPSVYDFDDYRVYLGVWFEAKRQDKKHYTHRRFAEEAGQSNVGILASLLSGRRSLTPNLVLALRRPLALSDAEAEFLGLLCDKEDAEGALRAAIERHERASSRATDASTRAARPTFDERRRQKTSANAASSASEAVREAEEALRAVRQEIAARRALARAELLAAQRLRVLSSWVAAALSELARSPRFSADPAWVTEALEGRADPSLLREALGLLEDLGELAPRGDDRSAPRARLTPLVVEARDVRAYYEGVYEQSGLALAAHFDADRRVQQERALLGALTVAIPSEEVPRLRALMQDVQRQIFAWLEGLEGERDVVYQLYLHLFPLSRALKGSGSAEGPGGGPAPG